MIERDDEFGDGWFLGKHMVNGNSGLFPEVYTRPAPRGITGVANSLTPTKSPLAPLPEAADPEESKPPPAQSMAEVVHPAPSPAPAPQQRPEPTATATATAPSLNAYKTQSLPASSTIKSLPVSTSGGSISSIGRMNASQDSQVLHETLNVIDEHITDLRSPSGNGTLVAATDSGSEYSSNLEHRMSYIQGEETDEEEEGVHTRAEVEGWSADAVAEYLFTAGVEKHHCEVFRDQEISGEVILGMDQTSLFIKAFDLGSVGRRLKTWQKIKSLQDEVNGQGQGTRRNTASYGSDVGSDDARRSIRSRTNTLTGVVQRLPTIEDRRTSTHSKRLSLTQTPRMEPAQLVSPVSPVSPASGLGDRAALHEKRPSAASVRDLHHSRRHSSTDYRVAGPAFPSPSPVTPKLTTSGTFPAGAADSAAHKKQPSFDRNWTLGSATSYNQRPLSSAGLPDAGNADAALADSAVDLDRGYFSSTDVDGRGGRRHLLKKRDSVQAHSRDNSYAEQQRVRSATAISRHSRYGSIDSSRDAAGSAAQKYYGLPASHRRTASTNTTESVRPVLPPKDGAGPSPTVTKLDGVPYDSGRSPISPISPQNRHGMHMDWLSKPGKAAGLGIRAISDAVTGHERAKLASPADASKDSPVQSPSRAGSSTPSAGPSFELDSPDTKSPSTTVTPASNRSAAKRKGKKDTSAYQRGLQKITPREAIGEADYSGWMKKKSSNLMTTWKPRLFVLTGRRLAYYYSEDDDQEKGLIDISFHRVLPADNERLTGLHATLTGASTTPSMPSGSHVATLAETEAAADTTRASDAMFIFKLVPPRAGLSRAVNFTKPTVHYFAVPNIKQGRLWMAALMKATIDRDDATPITTTYQQKTISLAKARQMRHRPPALMNLDEKLEDPEEAPNGKDANGLGITYNGNDSGVSGLEKMGLQKVESARSRQFSFEGPKDDKLPLSA